MDNKTKRSIFEQYSEEEKLIYRQKIFDLSHEIFSDEKNLKRLISYTLRKMRGLTKTQTINGLEAKDFIQVGILKTAEGKRFFAGESAKDLLLHLYYIIPSLLWNELKKIKVATILNDKSVNKKKLKNRFLAFNPALDDEEKILDITIKGTDTSILDALINRETIANVESFIYNELEKKEDYIGPYLYNAYIEGEPEPHKYVAKELNIPIEEVRNADKRLKRIINKAMRF